MTRITTEEAIREAISKCLTESFLVRAINGSSIHRLTDGVISIYRVTHQDMSEQLIDDKNDAIDEFLNASEHK